MAACLQSPNPPSLHPVVVIIMPKRVGKYEIGKTLGEGSFGKVKYAVNVETGEAVAIKVSALRREVWGGRGGRWEEGRKGGRGGLKRFKRRRWKPKEIQTGHTRYCPHV